MIPESYADGLRGELLDLGYSGATLDMLFEYLGDLSYEGSLEDRWFAYIVDNYGTAFTVADGAELGPELPPPTENFEDAENYIEDLGGNRYRFVGDGNTTTYLRWPITQGNRYLIVLSDVVEVSGSLKSSDGSDGNVFNHVTSDESVEHTFTNVDHIDIFRQTGGEAIDITFTVSVREVIPTPLLINTTLDQAVSDIDAGTFLITP